MLFRQVLGPVEPARFVHVSSSKMQDADVGDGTSLRGIPRQTKADHGEISNTDAVDAALASVERLGVHRHPLAQSLVAKKLIRRLVDDTTQLARAEAAGERVSCALRGAKSKDSLQKVVSELVSALHELRNVDNATVEAELPSILAFCGGEIGSQHMRYARQLAQSAGCEPSITLELLGQALMSKRGEIELQILFPPLSTAEASSLLQRAATVFLIMSRSSFAARAGALAQRLLSSLEMLPLADTSLEPSKLPSSDQSTCSAPVIPERQDDPFASSPAPRASLSTSPPPSVRPLRPSRRRSVAGPRAAEAVAVLAEQLAAMLSCCRSHVLPASKVKPDDAWDPDKNAQQGVIAHAPAPEETSEAPPQRRKSIIEMIASAISPRSLSLDEGDDLASRASDDNKDDVSVGMCAPATTKACRDSAPGNQDAEEAEPTFLDPRLLVYEYSTGVILRPTQVKLIRKLVQGANTGHSLCHQLLMGEGKTTVISPLLALLLADGGSLVLQIVPTPLLGFSMSVFRSCFSIPTLRKPVLSFSFDRRSEVTEALLVKVRTAITDHAIMVTAPAAVKAFTLKLLELLHLVDTGRLPMNRRRSMMSRVRRVLGLKRRSSMNLTPQKNAPNQEALLAQAQHATQLLALWRGAVAVIDEVDVILHPLRSELNWPLGDRYPLDFAPTRWELASYLLDAVLAAAMPDSHTVTFVCSTSAESSAFTQLCDAMTAGVQLRVVQRQPHLILLSMIFYQEALLPPLASLLLTWLRRQGLVDLTDAQLLKALLHDASETSVQSALADRHVKMLNLGADWLCYLLPHVLRKINRVNYGLLSPLEMAEMEAVGPVPRSRRFLAVPFLGKDAPSLSSEFAHPDVAIGLTTLSYRYEGLRQKDFGSVINHLQMVMESEGGPELKRDASVIWITWVQATGRHVRGTRPRRRPTLSSEEADAKITHDGGSTSVNQTPARGYSNAMGAEDILPLHLLDMRDAGYLDLLYRILLHCPHVVRFYLANLVFPEHLAHQHMKLSANGQDVGGELLFSRRIAFSGTPSSLLPLEMGECIYQMGDDAKMLRTVTNPLVVSHHLLDGQWDTTSLLNSVAALQPPAHALIDSGALCVGMTNLAVAANLLTLLQHVDGVVFLTARGEKKILLRHAGERTSATGARSNEEDNILASDGLVLDLDRCDVPKERRFSFFDQVHTTGMVRSEIACAHERLIHWVTSPLSTLCHPCAGHPTGR